MKVKTDKGIIKINVHKSSDLFSTKKDFQLVEILYFSEIFMKDHIICKSIY